MRDPSRILLIKWIHHFISKHENYCQVEVLELTSFGSAGFFLLIILGIPSVSSSVSLFFVISTLRESFFGDFGFGLSMIMMSNLGFYIFFTFFGLGGATLAFM